MYHVTSLNTSSVSKANRPVLAHHLVIVLAAATKVLTLMEMPYLADALYSIEILPENDLATTQKWAPVDRYIHASTTLS